MEYDGKDKKVYHGMVIPFICFLAVPLGVFFLLYAVLLRFTDHPTEICAYIALGFAGIVGFLFAMICLVSGFLRDTFELFIERIKDTTSYYKPFSKKAFSYYFYRFKEDGGIFIWVFFIFLIAFAIIAFIGFYSFFSWYNA